MGAAEWNATNAKILANFSTLRRSLILGGLLISRATGTSASLKHGGRPNSDLAKEDFSSNPVLSTLGPFRSFKSPRLLLTGSRLVMGFAFCSAEAVVVFPAANVLCSVT
jgi:hypothetical protein